VSARGTRHEASVAHASGTVANPMTDDALDRKFRANAEPVIGRANTQKVADIVWRLDALDDVRDVTALLA
jgi:2-methylcitrate dehydratase PrpD